LLQSPHTYIRSGSEINETVWDKCGKCLLFSGVSANLSYQPKIQKP